jgi:hypothetical protein
MLRAVTGTVPIISTVLAFIDIGREFGIYQAFFEPLLRLFPLSITLGDTYLFFQYFLKQKNFMCLNITSERYVESLPLLTNVTLKRQEFSIKVGVR